MTGCDCVDPIPSGDSTDECVFEDMKGCALQTRLKHRQKRKHISWSARLRVKCVPLQHAVWGVADALRASAKALRAAHRMYLAGAKSSARVRGPTAHTTETNTPETEICWLSASFHSETSENYLPSRVTACTTSTPGHIRFRGIVGGHATPVAATQWRPGTHRDRLERSLTDFKPSVLLLTVTRHTHSNTGLLCHV